MSLLFAGEFDFHRFKFLATYIIYPGAFELFCVIISDRALPCHRLPHKLPLKVLLKLCFYNKTLINLQTQPLKNDLQSNPNNSNKSFRKMNRASLTELRMHNSVLENGTRVFPEVFAAYSTHLYSSLLKWYKSHVMPDPSLAHEAVYEALKYYSEHPRAYNPENGSLKKFLEIGADRAMQKIFEREGHPLKLSSTAHVLAKHFDNERDMIIAKMILKNDDDMPAFISLLDLGSCRIKQQQTEIRRHTDRIRKVLEKNNLLARFAKKTRTKKISKLEAGGLYY